MCSFTLTGRPVYQTTRCIPLKSVVNRELTTLLYFINVAHTSLCPIREHIVCRLNTLSPLTLVPSGGRVVRVSGQNLDVVQEPKIRVTLSPPDPFPPRRRRSTGGRSGRNLSGGHDHQGPLKRWRRIVPEPDCPDGTLCHVNHERQGRRKTQR